MPTKDAHLPHAEPKLEIERLDEEILSRSPVGWPIALTVIAVLVVFYTLYFAASLLVPIAAAVLLSMLLSPAVQFLERLHVPRLLASADCRSGRRWALLGAGLAGLAGPAQSWIEKGPESLRKIGAQVLCDQEATRGHSEGNGPTAGGRRKPGPAPDLKKFVWCNRR